MPSSILNFVNRLALLGYPQPLQHSQVMPVSQPSETNDEVDDHSLPRGHTWAYPCKLVSCPDYGKSWLLRSNFLHPLRNEVLHEPEAGTAAARRTIELAWRYTTDPYRLPRAKPLPVTRRARRAIVDLLIQGCTWEDCNSNEHEKADGFRHGFDGN